MCLDIRLQADLLTGIMVAEGLKWCLRYGVGALLSREELESTAGLTARPGAWLTQR